MKPIQEQLVLENQNLIYHILKKLNLYTQVDEYYDIGIIGLTKAAKNYDQDKNIKFSTYAGRCIENEILYYLRRQNGNKLKANYNTVSLESVVYDENSNDILLKDIIPSNTNIEFDILHQEEIMYLYKALSSLNQVEKFILDYSYGLNNKMILTQKQLAEITNMSQPYVSRIRKKALKKLKEEMGKYYVCNTKQKQ